MTDLDVEHDSTPLDDLVALHTAEDADELRRRLILFRDAQGSTWDAFEPWCLLHGVHKDEPEGAVDTALLLLTDRRWRNATGRLVRRIEESELLPADDLDLLAEMLLAADAQLYWEVPAEWFNGPEIVIRMDPDDEGSDDEVPVEEVADGSDDAPVVFAREVRPPLRRWASARAVRAEPSRCVELVRRADELDPRSGAAVIRGILDEIDDLAPSARSMVLRLAAAWPQRDVREAAGGIPERPLPAATAVRVLPASRTFEQVSAQPSLF